MGADIVVTFSEEITKGTAGATIGASTDAITVQNSATGAFVAASITLVGNNLVINPVDSLSSYTHYTVTIGDGSVVDLAGNSYGGSTTYDFTTGALGSDPYAGGGSSDSDVPMVLGGITAFGILAWLLV